MRAAVELAKDWRTDRYLRRLEAMMIVADKDVSLVLTGTGDVLEPEAGVMGIGSGGNYALAAARALADDRARRRGDRAPLARHRGGHLRLHQPQRHGRDAEERLMRWRQYQFRPMSADDLPLVQRWLALPHVARMVGRARRAVRPGQRRPRTSPRWTSSSSRPTSAPFGYLQCYRPDRLEHRLRRRSPTARAASISSSASRTCSSAATARPSSARSSSGLLAAGTPRVVIDPDPANARAIRAYEKAGFRQRPPGRHAGRPSRF